MAWSLLAAVLALCACFWFGGSFFFCSPPPRVRAPQAECAPRGVAWSLLAAVLALAWFLVFRSCRRCRSPENRFAALSVLCCRTLYMFSGGVVRARCARARLSRALPLGPRPAVVGSRGPRPCFAFPSLRSPPQGRGGFGRAVAPLAGALFCRLPPALKHRFVWQNKRWGLWGRGNCFGSSPYSTRKERAERAHCGRGS